MLRPKRPGWRIVSSGAPIAKKIVSSDVPDSKAATTSQTVEFARRFQSRIGAGDYALMLSLRRDGLPCSRVLLGSANNCYAIATKDCQLIERQMFR
jgi:hypothetical protein